MLFSQRLKCHPDPSQRDSGSIKDIFKFLPCILLGEKKIQGIKTMSKRS